MIFFGLGYNEFLIEEYYEYEFLVFYELVIEYIVRLGIYKGKFRFM